MTRATTPTATSDVDIQRFLEAEGFVGDALPRARAELEAAGLTRPGKRRMAAEKLDPAREVLRARFIRLCHRKLCRAVDDPRERVFVSSRSCELCGGSPNRRAGDLARHAMLTAGYQHLLVVGGTPATHAALVESLASDRFKIRCIDGKQGKRSEHTIEADLDWADVLVLWATTPLPHRVSVPYTSRAQGRLPSITVARRGVEALCDELVRFAVKRSRHACCCSVTPGTPARRSVDSPHEKLPCR